MSLGSVDKELLFALRTPSKKRTDRELSVIYSSLCRLESLSSLKEQSLRAICTLARYETHNANEILYSFGKQIPGTKRRGCQCLVLEASEMIAIDYPDMTLHSGGINTRPHAFRHSSSNSASSTLDSVIEVESSSSESLHSSPMHQQMPTNLNKGANGQVAMRDDISQSSFSKEEEGEEDLDEPDIDEDDSISLHSTSSIVIKDLVIEVLKKDIADRNGDDLEILLEFTKSLRAFSNMTEPIRRALCKVMVFAWVEKAGTVVLKDDELLDSWSVIINGQVQVKTKDASADSELSMGDSFGVEATLQAQNHKGVMYTLCDDCQFLCIAQQEYYDVLHQGQENIQNIKDESGQIVMVKEKREFESGTKKGNIVIRGNADSLLHHLLEDNTIDSTYTDDFLLTYRAFGNQPLKICGKLLEWFDNPLFRDKVIRVILLWVNNHFNDFECDWRMMDLLEKFEDRLHQHKLQGETMLFNIACNAKAKPRTVAMTRQSNEVDLGFEIMGGSENNYPIYINKVQEGSVAETKGIKRGDLLMEVNGQNFEKLSKEKAHAILNKNTELNMTLKTSLFPFKQMVEELRNPQKKKKGKGEDKMPHPAGSRAGRMSLTMMSDTTESYDTKHRKANSFSGKTKRFIAKLNVLPKMPTPHGGDQVSVDDSMLGPQTPARGRFSTGSATIDGPRGFRQSSAISLSNPDLLDPAAYELGALSEAPEDVIKVYRADQTHRFVCVNRDTTAGDAVVHACKEFGIIEDVENYALYKVSVQGEKFVKQSKLPDPLAKLANIPLGSRYYLKNTMNSEQLLPDENIPELLKEANFSFLDLSCFEVALHLTREDYKMFQETEPTNFIEDLFHLDAELTQFKNFEDLVNRELFWVVTTICKEPNLIQRSKIIKHFIKIAQHCKIIKNLNSTFALVSGLGYRAVSRMKQTWEKVPAKSTRLFEELQALMDPSRNMSKYRTLLNDYISQPPVIPYIPVVKKDLYFLHLGNDTLVDGLINFEKMRMIGKEIRNVCRLCVADSSQIIPSAAATHQKELDKGTSSMYMTLTRRGRRSSFNNAKRMYEDQMNVRRVKQFMQQMEIVSDEDKLMEMSKAVEPALASAQPNKRRQAADSPSRSSRTLPMAPRSGSGSSGSGTLPSRNNSEPHLAAVPVIALHPTRKKIPVSSLPKFGAQSPQALKKLMALSEDGDGKKSREFKRSESSSSHELSPTNSPYLSPRHDNVKGAGQANHSVGLENVNRNNNRLSLPSVIPDPSTPAIHSAPATHKRFFPASAANSAPSSSRSSIASTSSLGTISSSNPTLSSTSSLGGNNSPRSGSPVPWTGSVGSLPGTGSASPRLLHGQQKNANAQRSSSSSSADTVKSAGGRHHHERPVIKQNRNARSGSFGGTMISAMSDRRFAHISTSSSTPSLNAPGTGSQASLILPNHPQIPRTPSIDSGVVSAGSLSADSTIFNSTDDADIFGRGYHPSHHQHHHNNQTHRHHQRSRKNDVQHHLVDSDRSHSPSTASVGSTSSSDRQRPQASSVQSQDSPREGDQDKVEQTFLSGFRGQGDPPRPENKDPFPTGGAGVNHAGARGPVGDMSVHHPGHVPPGVPHHQHKPFSALRGIQDYLICERHAAARRQYRTQHSAYNYTQVTQQFSPRPEPHVKTPEAILEEQLLLELQQQRPVAQKPRRKVSPPPETPTNLVDVRRLSLSKSDPSLHNPTIWESPEMGKEPPTASAVRPNMRLPLPNRTSSPKSLVQQNSLENMSPYSPLSDNVFPTSQMYSTPPGRPGMPAKAREIPSSAPNGPTRRMGNDPSFNWQYPGQSDHLTQSGNIPFLPQALNDRLNATVPAIGHSFNYNRSLASQYAEQAFSNTSVTHRAVKSSSFDIYNAQPTNQTPGNSSRDYPEARRKTSQDWSETDLDGDKLQQTMKAWGSSTSLPATPLSAQSTNSNGNHSHSTSSTVTPNSLNIQDKTRKSVSRLPPPPPPQRTSSIGRTRQLRLGSGSSSPLSSPPMSPSSTDGHVSFDDVIVTQNSSRMSLPPSGQMGNGHLVHQNRLSFSSGPDHKPPNNERRSLPSYTEAVKQINAKQKNLFPAPIPKTYRSFNMDPHENPEQVSQV